MHPCRVLLFAAFIASTSAINSALEKTFLPNAERPPFVWSWPLNMAHRGASGPYPEHTIEAYELAIKQGSQCIECDIVFTADNVPVCRHEPAISDTTNANEVYPGKITTLELDGTNITAVWTTNLTLAELKNLTAVQRLSFRDQSYNGKFQVATFEEQIQLAQSQERTVCLTPEIKHSTWTNAQPPMTAANTTAEDIVIALLNAYNFSGKINTTAWLANPLYIQSFEVGNLKYISSKADFPLAQLVDSADYPPWDMPNMTPDMMLSNGTLQEFSSYITAVCPWKGLITNVEPSTGAKWNNFSIVSNIHAFGMDAVTWTFRPESSYLLPHYYGDIYNEYSFFVNEIGVDGLFSDFPEIFTQWKKWSAAVAEVSARNITVPDINPVMELPSNRPLILAHRGNSGAFPEHTVAAYDSAIEMGADVIECDAVLTADLQVVCRHEPLLSNTTNADEKFPYLIKTVEIDGYNYTGVFAFDLTLTQIQTLTARQARPYRNQAYNDVFPVPTLEDYILRAMRAPRSVGIYVETKHPAFHDSLPNVRGANTSMTDIVLSKMLFYGYNGSLASPQWARKPCFLQSFEIENLLAARNVTGCPLILLLDEVYPTNPNITWQMMTTDDAFANYSALGIAGIGPWKNFIVQVNGSTNRIENITDMVSRAHAHNLLVHPYTFRNEEIFLASNYSNNPWAEYELWCNVIGADGLFTDFPLTMHNFLQYQLSVVSPLGYVGFKYPLPAVKNAFAYAPGIFVPGTVQVPIGKAHSHNNYDQPAALFDALRTGFCSIECDFFYINGTFMVAHDQVDASPNKTIQDMYLDPFVTILGVNNNSVYPSSTYFDACDSVLLMFDVKEVEENGTVVSNATEIFDALNALLESYEEQHPGMFTAFFKNGTIFYGPIFVFVSGDRPAPAYVANFSSRLLALDGRLPNVNESWGPAVYPVISMNFNSIIPEEEPEYTSEEAKAAWQYNMTVVYQSTIYNMLRTAHAGGHMVRSRHWT